MLLFCCLALLTQATIQSEARATVIEEYEKYLDSQGGRGTAGSLFQPLLAESISKQLRKHLDAANRHFRAGRLNLALQEIERASGLAPRSMTIAVALAELYNRVGRHDEAIKVAKTVLESMPQSAQPHDIVGTAFLRMNKPALAVKEYQEVIRKAPDHAIGYHHLGDAYWAVGKLEEALRKYDEALKRDPRAVDATVKSAALMQELGNNSKAIERARLALELAPQHALARAILGNALFATLEYSAAEEQYMTAIRLQPKFPYFLERLGELLVKRNDTAKAVTVYRRILEHDPPHLGAHQQLAKLYRQEKKPALAQYHLGFMAFASGKPKEAIEHYQAAVRQDPTLKGAYLDLATIYLRQKDPRTAASMAAKALALDSSDAVAHSILGQSRIAEGKAQEGREHLRRAIEANPGYSAAYLHLADLLKSEQKCQEAVAYYEKAIRRAAQAAATYRRLGDCYEALGRPDKATEAYRRAGGP